MHIACFFLSCLVLFVTLMRIQKTSCLRCKGQWSVTPLVSRLKPALECRSPLILLGVSKAASANPKTLSPTPWQEQEACACSPPRAAAAPLKAPRLRDCKNLTGNINNDHKNHRHHGSCMRMFLSNSSATMIIVAVIVILIITCAYIRRAATPARGSYMLQPLTMMGL